MSSPATQALIFGVDPLIEALVAGVFGATRVKRVASYDELNALMEAPTPPEQAVMVCGSQLPGIDANELAQLLRVTFLESPVYFADVDRARYDRARLRKNGFLEAFLLPLDHARFTDTLREASTLPQGQVLYRPICLVDLQPGEKLEFDTYLHMPLNNKHLRFSAAGDAIDAARLERLKGKEIKSLHVAHADLERVYSHVAARLKTLLPGSPGNAIGETERRQRLCVAVRDLITDMVNTATEVATIDNGKVLRSSAQDICKKLLTSNGSDTRWFDKFSRVAVEAGDDYTHFSAVATYATLFSLGLGIGNPDEVALAGLLHDLGMADVPGEVAAKNWIERTPAERVLYEKHVEGSIALIKQRKLVLPTNVHAMIAQHHERWDGGGFPGKLAENKLNPGTLVLALADQLEEALRVREGQSRPSAQGVLLKFRDENRFPPRFIEAALALLTS